MPTTRLQSRKAATLPKIEENFPTTRRARKGTTTTRAAGSRGKTKSVLKADSEGNDEAGVKAEEDQPPAKKKRGGTGPRRREVEVVYKEGKAFSLGSGCHYALADQTKMV